VRRKLPRQFAPVRKGGYADLVGGLTELLEEARRTSARSVNAVMTATYWEVGRRIVEHEQGGQRRAGYGEQLLKRLASDLTAKFGRGFGLSNLKMIKKFYLTYELRGKGQTVSGQLKLEGPERKRQTVSGLSSFLAADSTKEVILQTLSEKFGLSWSHYVRLLSIDDAYKRDFYEEEALRGGWSVRQLDRQVNSMLYERVALSRNKGDLLRKAGEGSIPTSPEEEIRDPYLLEFLGLPKAHSEKDLEDALIQHLADFLLELGYGFTFVARQKRLQIGSQSYYLDLLFYHRRLRCLVAIDLKIGQFSHADAGQMNLYLNYAKEHWTHSDENPPIGLILCAKGDEAVAHYALGGLSNKVFASRYKLQLPDPKILKREIEAEWRRLEQRVLLKR
jgi:predicted nuclease of restriction endonuclease-like (RecB) superfamily